MKKNSKGLCVALASLVVTIATASAAVAGDGTIHRPEGNELVPNQYLVTFVRGVDPAVAANEMAATHGGQVEQVFGHIRTALFRMNQNQAFGMAHNPNVEWVAQDSLFTVDTNFVIVAEYEIAPDVTEIELSDGRIGYRASGPEAARELAEMFGQQEVELETAGELGFGEAGQHSSAHTAGLCSECSPSWTLACGFGSLSWEQVCLLNGSTPIYPIGGNCGWCYGYVCEQVPNQGNVGASPTTVQVSSGTGCTDVSWNLTCGSGSVCVRVNNGSESLFASGNSGSQPACWIQAGKTYTFSLYEGGCGSNLLDSVQVTGVQAPDPCSVCAPGTSCHCFDNVCRPNDSICP